MEIEEPIVRTIRGGPRNIKALRRYALAQLGSRLVARSNERFLLWTHFWGADTIGNSLGFSAHGPQADYPEMVQKATVKVVRERRVERFVIAFFIPSISPHPIEEEKEDPWQGLELRLGSLDRPTRQAIFERFSYNGTQLDEVALASKSAILEKLDVFFSELIGGFK